jgi:Mn-dependent DtxR family transcriptional regulator
MKKLSPAMEDYLKKIYQLSGDDADKIVHVSELALQMKVSKPCASRATDTLSEKSLLMKNKYQGVSLTTDGKQQAELLIRRHSVIRRFLSDILHVDPLIAEQDACGIEHSISPESYQSLTRYLDDIG